MTYQSDQEHALTLALMCVLGGEVRIARDWEKETQIWGYGGEIWLEIVREIDSLLVLKRLDLYLQFDEKGVSKPFRPTN